MRRSIPQRETSSTGLSKPVTVRCLSLSQSLTHKKTDLSLDHLEFSALPSGLHLVDQDVMCAPPSLLLSSSQFSSSYFTKDGQHGVCVFRRRKSTEQGHRGFRLSSLGILLAKSKRPRPWRHVPALKHLAQSIESAAQLQPTGRDWDPAEAFFAARKITRSDLGGAGDWNGWSDELDVVRPLFFFFFLLFLILMIIQDRADILNVPTIHLPHLLRIIGPSSLTLFKHVLGRQRILIYTLPPVEVACILCQAAADMCYQVQTAPDPSRIKARNRDPICVLGMVTLSDLDRLHLESQSTRGWIACTTDALFLEKPSYYDLLIDLTTSTPHKATRPTFYASKPVSHTKTSTHRLSTIRFAWSDVKLVSSCSLFFHSDLILDTSGTRSSVYYNSTRTHRTVVLPPLPHQTLFPRLLNRNLYLHGRTLGACMKMCVLYVLGCGWARGAVILCSRIRV